MICPVCPTAGWLGGWIGGYVGVLPPQHPKGRLLSAFITANLMSITIIALKVLFNVSLCSGGGWTLNNIVKVSSKALVMGVIYSIGVNYLLNRYVFKSNESSNQASESSSNNACPTCCSSSTCKDKGLMD